MNTNLLQPMIDIACASGGSIKFDIKAWDENLHRALTGVTNVQTLDNFQFIGKMIDKRPELPLLIASTLLIPGYIDEEEIHHIARFITSINPSIPYTLLAFYPHFYMSDLPLTSKDMAYRCLHTATAEGLKNVKLGNIHLLA